MQKVSLNSLYEAALTYRRHEAAPGATYHLKSRDDPNSPGLWFVSVPERLEIATEKSRDDSSIQQGSRTREACRSAYTFENKIIPVGDAVCDTYIAFSGLYDDMPEHDLGERSDDKTYLPRKRYGPSSMGVRFPGEFGEAYRYKYSRDHGALIQFHVPRKDLDEKYEFDVEQKCYREKPFKKKFVEQPLMVELPDGSAVEIPAGHDIIFFNEGYSIQKTTSSSSLDKWLVDGQDMMFYLSAISDGLSKARKADKSIGEKSSTLFAAMLKNLQSREKNPYESTLLMGRFLSHHFNASSNLLPEEMKQDFESFMEETERKHAYFEVHPVVM